jgi:VWFA-related protein
VRLLLCLSLIAAVPTAAAEAPQTITLDVVYDGPSRATLTSADFTVSEGGQPLKVESARLVQPSADTTPLPVIGTAATEENAAENADRLVAVYVDEYHLSPGADFDAARTALAALLRTQLGPKDLVLVLKPLQSLLALRLTTDRESAAHSVETADPRQDDFEPRTAFERNFIAGSPARIAAARAEMAMSSLGALASHLGRFPSGRKTLIVLSNGFAYQDLSGSESRLPNVDVVARAANRARVAVYVVKPGGPGPAATQAFASTTPQAADALTPLAQRTTGLVFDAAHESPATALQQVVRDASRYYLLTVTSTLAVADGRFRNVDVKLRQGGASVRARAGYAVRPANTASASARTSSIPAGLLVPRRTSPMIRAWFGQSGTDEGQTRVSFVWEPAPRVPGDRRQPLTPARVSITVSTMDGAPVFSGAATSSSNELSDGTPGQDAELSFLTQPSRLLVQMEVLDVAGQVIDRDARDLIVGAFDRTFALGTAAVYRTRSAVELRALQGSDRVAPVASRQFSRAEHLVVRMPLVSRSASPTVAARLRSSFGSTLRELPVTIDGGVCQVDLSLASLASGRYEIEFAARAGDRSVVEQVPFTVTP